MRVVDQYVSILKNANKSLVHNIEVSSLKRLAMFECVFVETGQENSAEGVGVEFDETTGADDDSTGHSRGEKQPCDDGGD